MRPLFITHDIGVAQEVADRVGVMYAGRIVEEGVPEQVLGHPVHSYTVGLLESAPTPDVSPGALNVIPGHTPVLGDDVRGCAFSPRCPHAQAACLVKVPDLVAVGQHHLLACPVREHLVGKFPGRPRAGTHARDSESLITAESQGA